LAKNKKTKKALAFELFDQGYTPSDLIVKGVGLKGKTRYGYFGQWKQKRGLGAASVPMGENPLAPAGKNEAVVAPVTMTPQASASVEETALPEEEIEDQAVPEESAPLFTNGELKSIPSAEPTVSAEARNAIKTLEPPQPASEIEEPAEAEPDSTEGTPDDSGNGKGSEAQLESAEDISAEDTVTEHKDGKERKTVLPRHIPTQGLKLNGVEVSVQTLYLYNVAHAQAKQVDPDVDLSIGAFFDHCVERYYSDRGYRVGLVLGGTDVK